LEFKDYYATLGVGKEAPQDEVQRAYRKLARKFHPDLNKAPEAEAKFKEIGEAYEVLKDPEKRSKYDQYGAAWKQAQARGGGAPGGPGWQEVHFDFGDGGGGFDFRGADLGGLGGEGFSSFFEMLFGGGGPGGGSSGGRAAGGPRSGAAFARRGADVEADITLSLEEAARGGRREITLADPSSGERNTLAVTLPKGVRSGQRIRLAGKGGAGTGGGPAGDLFLKVSIAHDRRFRLKGTDLYTTVPVAPWEAALGGEATVDTLDGPVRIKIPAGSSSGKTIRLRGRGFPAKNGDAGNLYAEVSIVVPESLSAAEEKLYRELAETSTFRPRE
jgi:curved DNA-binding protein